MLCAVHFFRELEVILQTRLHKVGSLKKKKWIGLQFNCGCVRPRLADLPTHLLLPTGSPHLTLVYTRRGEFLEPQIKVGMSFGRA